MTIPRVLPLLAAVVCLASPPQAHAQQFDSVAAAQAARRLADLGDELPAQADSAYAALLARAPGYALAWAERAEFERKRDSLVSARRYVERALALRPRMAQALVVRGDLTGRDDIGASRADFLAAVDADTAWAVPRERVGRTYRWQGDCAAARPWFLQALRRAPDGELGRVQLEGCTTPRERADLLSGLIAARPTERLIRWRLSLPDSVVTQSSRLDNFDTLLRLLPNAAVPATLVARVQRARLLQRLGRNVDAAASCDSIVALVTAQRDSLGTAGKPIIAGALLIRAEARAYPPRYREAVADLDLAERVAGRRIIETVDPAFYDKRTGYRVEAVYYENDLPSLRALTRTTLDTSAYRRLGERTPSGANSRRLEQLQTIGREVDDPRARPGFFFLLAAHAEPLGRRELVATALRGGYAALEGIMASRSMYEAYLEDMMARHLVQDLGLRVGTTYFCRKTGAPDQGFRYASYEERLTKQGRLISWGDVLADGRAQPSGWSYDPAQRTLSVARASGTTEQWTVAMERLRSSGRELLPCR